MGKYLKGIRQNLMVTNVFCADYSVHVDEFGLVLDDMYRSIVSAGYTPKSDMFYSTPQLAAIDDTLNVTVYLPVIEEFKGEEVPYTDYKSYLFVPRMYGVRVAGDDDADFSEALLELSRLLNDEDVDVCTPLFYLTSKINGKLYTDIKVGIR